MLEQAPHSNSQVHHYPVSLSNLEFSNQVKLNLFKEGFSNLTCLASNNKFQVSQVSSILSQRSSQAPQLHLSIISSFLTSKYINCLVEVSQSLMEQFQTLLILLHVPRIRLTLTKTSL
jgi:hypothetical protein